MATGDYIAVETGRAGASFLTKNADEVVRWGNYYVMSMAIYQDFLLRVGTTVLSRPHKDAWNDITFKGETEYGVWLKGASMSDVQLVTSTYTKHLNFVHISENAYNDLRRRFPRWWTKAFEQRGWDKVPPTSMTWVSCGDPTPDEMKLYTDLLKKRAWESKIPSEVKRFTNLYEMCDPSGKLLTLAKMK